jgi:CHAT domain-containing protein
MKKNSSSLICVLVLSFALSCFGQNHSLPTADMKSVVRTETQTLAFGQTIERDIAGGERHSYKINLSANQFVKIEAEQKNCDVMLTLQSPENVNVFEYKDDNYQNGAEVQTAAVTAAGEYELKIISFEEPEQKGKYTLKFSELRSATDKETSQTSGFQIINRLSKIQAGTATTGEIKQIIADYRTALEKFRFAENRQYESLSLSCIGAFYSRLGDWKKAVEMQKQALEIHRRFGRESDTALVLSNLGTNYLRNDEPQKALETLYEAVAVSVKREDVFNESRALRFIGNVYEETGDVTRALTYYAQAAEKAQAISEPQFAATALYDLGEATLSLGDHQKALEHFQKSIEIARRLKNKRLEAAALGSLGQIHFALGNEAKSAELLTDALAVNRSLADKIGEAATLKRMGKIRLALGKTDEAVELLAQAETIYRLVEGSQNLAETLLLLAKAESKKGNLDAAQTKTEEAITLMEKIRSRVEIAGLRDSFSSNLRNYYAFYIEIMMARHKLAPDKNYAALALQANERARARGLLNLLAESNADIRQGADEKLIQKETTLKNLLAARLENLTKVLNGKTKIETTEKLKNEVEQIRAEYEQTQTQIRSASPRYAALTQPKTLDLREIQTQVLDDDSVLLEYALGETRSYLWIVTKNDFQTIELPAKAEIEKTARRFYEFLTARNQQIKFETPNEREDRIFLADSDSQKFSGELSSLILAPAAAFLPNKRLLIVADGALQYVPFSSLESLESPGSRKGKKLKPKAENRYLIETNEIVNLPSVSVLAVLRNETKNRKMPAKTLAVLADPVFDEADERLRTSAAKNKSKPEFVAVSKKETRGISDFATRNGLDLPRLPFTRREADSIAALVSSSQHKKFFDFAANRQAAMSSELADYRFVHFATHGFINNENPELSGIVLSLFDENGREQDGFLRVGDVYNLKLPVEAVVLSGCKTGLGKEISGEGLIGLTRGFMYAGAKRVAVSLWDVNDEATAELMGKFYKGMLDGEKLSPAAALRKAQIEMIKDKRWRNPYFWSVFILQGEPR